MSYLSHREAELTAGMPRKDPEPGGGRRDRRLCRLAQEIASAAFDVPVDEIRSPNRSLAASCEARHAAMYVAHVSFQVPLVFIAREFGRDRTSVGHAIRRVEDRRDDAGFDHRLARVESLAQTCLALLSGAIEP